MFDMLVISRILYRSKPKLTMEDLDEDQEVEDDEDYKPESRSSRSQATRKSSRSAKRKNFFEESDDSD